MARSTKFLGLVLPSLGEFFNRWDRPVNENFEKLDTKIEEHDVEIVEARGDSASLADRIGVALNDDGSLKDVPEVASARSSKVYGSGAGSIFFDLDQRIEESDNEIFQARHGLTSLRDIVAWSQDDNPHNCLVDGPTNPITFSGAVVTLNGGTTPVVSNINGHRCVTPINDQITITGVAGIYYLFLDRNPNGKLIYTTPATSGSTGLITSTNKLSKYKATGTNLVTSGIKPGHILEVTAPGGNLNLGRWIVLETANENPTDLGVDEVRIIGEFNSSSTGLSAAFYDADRPTFNFTASAHSVPFARIADRIFVGRCVFDGTNVTSLTQYAYDARYEAWHAVTPLGGDFTLNIPHNLGYIPKRIALYASQANDFTQPLEPMSVAKASQGSVSITAGDQTITYTAPALRRSVVARMTDTNIEIKNSTNGIFYEDFNNTAQTTGFLYVVVER